MLFAVPVVGRVLAGCAAAEASQNASATQKIDQLKLEASSGGSTDSNSFAAALSSLGQSAVSQAAQPAQSSLLSTALSIASKL